jgi:hypothetical protein
MMILAESGAMLQIQTDSLKHLTSQAIRRYTNHEKVRKTADGIIQKIVEIRGYWI